MFYSSDASGLRDFLRDKLGFKATDVGGGWLIFDLPEADMGCHPANETEGAPSGTHDISFYCDDIYKTVDELKAKGVNVPVQKLKKLKDLPMQFSWEVMPYVFI